MVKVNLTAGLSGVGCGQMCKIADKLPFTPEPLLRACENSRIRHIRPVMRNADSQLTAVLGPTNTGKTHLAVERLCAHSSGMMGFPLRLLAREIYDRVAAIKGKDRVALITGEERIEPPQARWFLCTVESMPMTDRDFAFVAIDEAQLGADPERGHVFTDRLLHARGREETMVLGSESLRSIIRTLLPTADIVSRPRFSTLSYAGAKKLSRLPPRSAIVAFSVEEVYAVAEMLRRFRGGAAVVMGALSPSTRNAQVEMFQSGEVDYMVATDAIGMGLNLDVSHVAFASLSKFDGKRQRRLSVAEMAQIAGRAGRHQRDGTFGTLAGEAADFTPEEIEAIENHRFPRLEQLYWRESEPRFDNLPSLIADLEQRPISPDIDGKPVLIPTPETIDLAVLRRLSEDGAIAASARRPAMVARLWAAASLPDFQQLGSEHHARFVARLWQHLGHGNGRIPQAWAAQQLTHLDNVQGDIATLSGRISAVRTWSYIANRPDWLPDPAELAARTRALEERLSDALHERLRQRFVDRRTSVLLRKLGKDNAFLPVSLAPDGAVIVDGETIGRLDGFRFSVAPEARMAESRMLLAAAEKYLGGIMSEQAQAVANASDEEFRLGPDASGRPAIFWKDAALGLLESTGSLLSPRLKPHKALAGLEGADLKSVVQRAEKWIEAQIAKHLGGVDALFTLSQGSAVPGPVRALAVQLAEAGGLSTRHGLNDAVNALDKDQRASLRKAGVVFGALDVFHHAAVKPGATLWRNALMAVRAGSNMPAVPPESAVHLADWRFADAAHCRNAGYRRLGQEHLRIDMAERLVKKAHEARAANSKDADFAFDLALATSLGLSEGGLELLMRDAGFRRVKPKQEAAPAISEESKAATEDVPPPEASAEAGPPAADAVTAEAVTGEPAVAHEAAQVAAVPEKRTPQPGPVMHLRWIGMKKPKREVIARPTSALGEQLAALTARR